VSPPPFSTLRKTLAGAFLEPADPGFEDARVLFNAMIATRPAAIAQVADVADIIAAIRFARDHGIRLAVRSGGHSVAGHSLVEDGLVIDMRRMASIDVNPAARTVRVGGGAAWGPVDRATQAHGLATTGGRVTTTGVAGYTLGGGNGWLDRTFGLAVDNLLSADLVTADGRQVTASADEHPDLFWAIRGGGGNFGVATSFTFRLHPVGTVYAGIWFFVAEQGDRGERITRTYRDVMDAAPKSLGGGLIWLRVPPDPTVPPELHHRLCVGVIVCHVGDPAEGERLMAPVRAFEPDLDAVGVVPYADFNGSLDDPPGHRNYWTAEYVRAFDDRAVGVFVDHSRRMPHGTRTASMVVPAGGAVREVGEDDTPLTSRSAAWHLHPFGIWKDAAQDAECIAWARGIRAAFQPFATGGVYLNFIGNEGEDRVVSAFGRQKYERLARIKAAWDPDNVFHGNQNIRPRR
jgi:FAD/FMN-containing dehydrogenase